MHESLDVVLLLQQEQRTLQAACVKVQQLLEKGGEGAALAGSGFLELSAGEKRREEKRLLASVEKAAWARIHEEREELQCRLREGVAEMDKLNKVRGEANKVRSACASNAKLNVFLQKRVAQIRRQRLVREKKSGREYKNEGEAHASLQAAKEAIRGKKRELATLEKQQEEMRAQWMALMAQHEKVRLADAEELRTRARRSPRRAAGRLAASSVCSVRSRVADGEETTDRQTAAADVADGEDGPTSVRSIETREATLSAAPSDKDDGLEHEPTEGPKSLDVLDDDAAASLTQSIELEGSTSVVEKEMEVSPGRKEWKRNWRASRSSIASIQLSSLSLSTSLASLISNQSSQKGLEYSSPGKRVGCKESVTADGHGGKRKRRAPQSQSPAAAEAAKVRDIASLLEEDKRILKTVVLKLEHKTKDCSALCKELRKDHLHAVCTLHKANQKLRDELKLWDRRIDRVAEERAMVREIYLERKANGSSFDLGLAMQGVVKFARAFTKMSMLDKQAKANAREGGGGEACQASEAELLDHHAVNRRAQGATEAGRVAAGGAGKEGEKKYIKPLRLPAHSNLLRGEEKLQRQRPQPSCAAVSGSSARANRRAGRRKSSRPATKTLGARESGGVLGGGKDPARTTATTTSPMLEGSSSAPVTSTAPCVPKLKLQQQGRRQEPIRTDRAGPEESDGGGGGAFFVTQGGLGSKTER